jgi:HEAT repeat protein
VSHLPPEDQPDVIWIGPVGPIPIHYEDDPRFEEERALWHDANVRSQAMLTADELLAGLENGDWRVRHGVIDRLIARASDDERTVPALIAHLHHDTHCAVRQHVAMALTAFSYDARVVDALRKAASDEDADVRWSVAFSLFQLGSGPLPPGMDTPSGSVGHR